MSNKRVSQTGPVKMTRLTIFIQEMQLRINSKAVLIFEWIPYNKFNSVKEIGHANNDILKINRISQHPDTKDYIMVLAYAKGGNFQDWMGLE
ncbi:hypothetical protein RhiirC2_789124 [Rhizophagus irregularis]|uniref:Uncharacterized protein n=1 Tax=Rhizophagus irregularis TaxID=588596 RepID=A0A2N1MNS0_9GLOM|nr:hypothetical protein RhiirC2_789124 [Rhizophagus irregularis]